MLLTYLYIEKINNALNVNYIENYNLFRPHSDGMTSTNFYNPNNFHEYGKEYLVEIWSTNFGVVKINQNIKSNLNFTKHLQYLDL